tara:strand:- start:466 stop:660 length:195 start_codon:yes stop_codon:yes gene_type:complete
LQVEGWVPHPNLIFSENMKFNKLNFRDRYKIKITFRIGIWISFRHKRDRKWKTKIKIIEEKVFI